MSSSASGTDAYLRIGSLKRPHGLRGEIAVAPIGDFPDVIRSGARVVALIAARDSALIAALDPALSAALDPVHAPAPGVALEIESARPHGTHVLVKFAGRDSIDAVAPLSGLDIAVERNRILRPADDFLFDDEVAGFACVDAGGESLGRAEAFERHGPGCYLRVARDGRTALVPFSRPIVREVSRERREIVLDPPEGLFDL